MSYYFLPIYPNTCGLKQLITPIRYAIVSLLLALTMKYLLCVGNPIPELTTNHFLNLDHLDFLSFSTVKHQEERNYYLELNLVITLAWRVTLELSRYSFLTKSHSKLFASQTFANMKVTHYQVSKLLDGIAKQVETEGMLQKETNAEVMLIQAFMFTHITSALCLASKKKRIDPSVPSNFDEACEYPARRAGIQREFNACVKGGTCSYAKFEPFTWVLKMKHLDAKGKKFMERLIVA